VSTVPNDLQDPGLEMQGHSGQWEHRQSRFDRDGGKIGAEDAQTPESIQSDMATKRTPGMCYKTMLGKF
jgi:hypothetical protein